VETHTPLRKIFVKTLSPSLSISFTNTHTFTHSFSLSLSPHTHTHTHTKIHITGDALKWVFLNIMWVTYEKFPPLPLNNIFLPPDCEDRENVCTRHTVTRCNAFKIEVIYSLVSYSALILTISCGVNCMIIFGEEKLLLIDHYNQNLLWYLINSHSNVFLFFLSFRKQIYFLRVLRLEDALNFKTLTPSHVCWRKKDR